MKTFTHKLDNPLFIIENSVGMVLSRNHFPSNHFQYKIKVKGHRECKKCVECRSLRMVVADLLSNNGDISYEATYCLWDTGGKSYWNEIEDLNL